MADLAGGPAAVFRLKPRRRNPFAGTKVPNVSYFSLATTRALDLAKDKKDQGAIAATGKTSGKTSP